MLVTELCSREYRLHRGNHLAHDWGSEDTDSQLRVFSVGVILGF